MARRKKISEKVELAVIEKHKAEAGAAGLCEKLNVENAGRKDGSGKGSYADIRTERKTYNKKRYEKIEWDYEPVVQSPEELALLAEISELLNSKEVDDKTLEKLKQWKAKKLAEANAAGKKQITWHYGFAEEIAQIRGVELVSVASSRGRITRESRVIYVCKHGTRTKTTLEKLASGIGCHNTRKQCPGVLKLVTELVKKAFRARGWKILHEDKWQYQGTKIHIPFVCNKNHKHKIVWDNYRKGQGCGKCCSRDLETMEQKVREVFRERGWTIIEPYAYTGTKEYIHFYCENGHKHKITWGSVIQGVGCGKCFGKDKVFTEKRIRAAFIARGWTIIEPWLYVDNNTHIPFVCENGHKHSITWRVFEVGGGCGACAGYNRELRETRVRAEIASRGWTLVEPWIYTEAYGYVYFICDKGHYHRIRCKSLLEGRGCGQCNAERRPFHLESYSLSCAANWIYGRVLSDLGWGDDEAKEFVEKALSLLSNEKLQLVADIRSERMPCEDTDHRVPFSFFISDDPRQIAYCNDPDNLRNLHSSTNRSRSNHLTVTEIMHDFDTPEIRKIYNLAGNVALKEEFELPLEIPVEDIEFQEWCEDPANQPSLKDLERYERWNGYEELVNKVATKTLHVYDSTDLID